VVDFHEKFYHYMPLEDTPNPETTCQTRENMRFNNISATYFGVLKWCMVIHLGEMCIFC